MKPQRYFDVRQQGSEADIYIYGEITPYPWDEGDSSAMSLKEALQGLDVSVINVYINSPGGSVAEGWTIYSELKRHPAKVRTYGDGFIASAALYPFMAGDERYAVTPCAFFFHQMSNYVWGNADDMRKAAEELEKLNEIGRAAFTDNTELTAEAVKEMEQAETWLSPEEALELGIATAVIATKPTAVAAQSAKAAIIQRVLEGAPPAGGDNPQSAADAAASSFQKEPLTPAGGTEAPPPEEKARDEPGSIMDRLARMAAPVHDNDDKKG